MKQEDYSLPSPATPETESLIGGASVTLRPRPIIPEQWVWHFRSLVGLRARLMKDRDRQMAEAAVPIEVDSESADSATDEFDHDLALAMWESKDEMLQEVDAAIQRIRDGGYGLCEETGKVIPAARLMAMPWARYTLEAEEKLEDRGQKLGPQLCRLHPIASPGEVNAGTSDESDKPPKSDVRDLEQIAAPIDDSTP